MGFSGQSIKSPSYLFTGNFFRNLKNHHHFAQNLLTFLIYMFKGCINSLSEFTLVMKGVGLRCPSLKTVKFIQVEMDPPNRLSAAYYKKKNGCFTRAFQFHIWCRMAKGHPVYNNPFHYYNSILFQHYILFQFIIIYKSQS